MLVTLHLPLPWYSPGALFPRRPDTHFTVFPARCLLMPSLAAEAGAPAPMEAPAGGSRRFE